MAVSCRKCFDADLLFLYVWVLNSIGDGMGDNSGNNKKHEMFTVVSLSGHIFLTKPSKLEYTAGQPNWVCLRVPGPYAAMFNVNFRFRLRLFQFVQTFCVYG